MATIITNTYSNSILNGSYENIIQKFKIQKEGSALKKGDLLYWNKFTKNYSIGSGDLTSITIKLREKVKYGTYEIRFVSNTTAKVTSPDGEILKNDGIDWENLVVGQDFLNPQLNIKVQGTFAQGDKIYIYITPTQEYKLGLMKPYDPNSAFDYVGEKEIFGVLLEDVDTTGEEKEALVLVKGIVNEGKINYNSNFTQDDKLLIKEDAKKKGILFI